VVPRPALPQRFGLFESRALRAVAGTELSVRSRLAGLRGGCAKITITENRNRQEMDRQGRLVARGSAS